MDTATSWVSKTPGVCGGDACIRTTRHTVYGLVEWKRMGLTDARILEHHPDLTQADLDAAWDYYAQHPDEIDQAIRDDAEA
jgi:uncharacterized protein (DUF433 family)